MDLQIRATGAEKLNHEVTFMAYGDLASSTSNTDAKQVNEDQAKSGKICLEDGRVIASSSYGRLSQPPPR